MVRVNMKKKEAGASMIEYTLLVALISILAIGSMRLVGQEASATFEVVSSRLDEVNN